MILDTDVFEKALEPIKTWAYDNARVKMTMLDDNPQLSSKNKVGEVIIGVLDLIETQGEVVVRVSSSYTNYKQTRQILKVIDSQEFRVVIECLDGVYSLEKV